MREKRARAGERSVGRFWRLSFAAALPRNYDPRGTRRWVQAGQALKFRLVSRPSPLLTFLLPLLLLLPLLYYLLDSRVSARLSVTDIMRDFYSYSRGPLSETTLGKRKLFSLKERCCRNLREILHFNFSLNYLSIFISLCLPKTYLKICLHV